jgi:carboxymethylenebutenolidase
VRYYLKMEKNSIIGNIPAYRADPKGACKGGILLIHEVWGLSHHIKDVADRFAEQGYLVLAPNLLSDTEIEAKLTPELQKDLFDPKKRNAAQPKLRELMAPLQSPEFARITIDKVKICFDFFYKEPEANHKIAVVGYCFGGTYSYHLAAHEPRLKAAVAYYGHADLNVEQLKAINCPILAFYGENDERLIESLPDLADKMKMADVTFNYKVYQNTGHAFFNDTNPFAFSKDAASDSWSRTLDFLSQVLGDAKD